MIAYLYHIYQADDYLYEQSFPIYPIQHLQVLLLIQTPLLLQLFGHYCNWAQNLVISGHVIVPYYYPNFTDTTYPLVVQVTDVPSTFIITFPLTH